MPPRTQVLKVMPSNGGLNTSLDASLIPATQLTIADNVIFDTEGARKKREGINFGWDDSTSNTHKVLRIHDYWYGSSGARTQKLVAITDAPAFISYSSAGAHTTLTDAGTAWSNADAVSTITFNNKLIMAATGTGNVIKYWDGSSSIADLPGSPPPASILREHLGRIWCNSKTNPDRLYYSPAFDHTLWNGVGDSGAIDIGIGDGDPVGITAIFPTFKGDLFVAKRTKLYRVTGSVPEEFQVEKISDSLGCIAHNSICAAETEDMFFISDKGIHSLGATIAYGDFAANYVSFDIQKTFNTYWTNNRLKYAQAVYYPSINSVAFAVTENVTLAQGRSLTTSTVNNTIYFYNTQLKAWFRWPDVPCSALAFVTDSDKQRLYVGSHTGRVYKCFNGTNYDISEAGVNTAVQFRIVTGQIVPGGDMYMAYAFKRVIIYYKPNGAYSLIVRAAIDKNRANPENTNVFSEAGSVDLLGSTFILGTSALGNSGVVAPHSYTIDGIGRSIQLTISQRTIDEDVDIIGFAVEFEPLGTIPELVPLTGADS